jgi:hypothetical protein
MLCAPPSSEDVGWPSLSLTHNSSPSPQLFLYHSFLNPSLLTVDTETLSVPQSGSPAFGSPIRLVDGRAEEEEGFAALHVTLEAEIPDIDETMRIEKPKRRNSDSQKARKMGWMGL